MSNLYHSSYILQCSRWNPNCGNAFSMARELERCQAGPIPVPNHYLTQGSFYNTTLSIYSRYWLILPSLAPIPIPTWMTVFWSLEQCACLGWWWRRPMILLMVGKKRIGRFELREVKRSFEKIKFLFQGCCFPPLGTSGVQENFPGHKALQIHTWNVPT